MGAVAVKQSSNDTTRKHKVNEQIPGTAGASIFSSPYIAIQRKPSCPCGGGCPRCRGVIQPKLIINQPGDIYEQEADQIADQVMAAPANLTVSSISPHIQRFSKQSNRQTGATPGSVDRVLASPGMPLDTTLQQDMEQRFGYDFSRVRVHSGAVAEQSARDVNANAYTVGHNIVFGAGRFAPGTHEGQRLIAHELTHVVQQSNEPKQAILQRKEENNADLAAIQGLPMYDLLTWLSYLPENILDDEKAGGFVGGPRLVTAMRAVKAKMQKEVDFLSNNRHSLESLPPDQAADILNFLFVHDERFERRIELARRQKNQEKARKQQEQDEETRIKKQDEEEKSKLHRWSFFGALLPDSVQPYYRDPSREVTNPVYRIHAETNTGAAFAGARLARDTTAAVSAAVGTVMLVAEGALALDAVVMIALEGAAASQVATPIISIIVNNPIAASDLAVFAGETILSIVIAGGVKQYIDSLATPEGIFHIGVQIFLHGSAFGAAVGRGKVQSVAPNGTVSIRLIKPPQADNAPPPAILPQGTSKQQPIPPRSQATGAPVPAKFPKVAGVAPGSHANDTLPSNVSPLRQLQPPEAPPIAVASGQYFVPAKPVQTPAGRISTSVVKPVEQQVTPPTAVLPVKTEPPKILKEPVLPKEPVSPKEPIPPKELVPPKAPPKPVAEPKPPAEKLLPGISTGEAAEAAALKPSRPNATLLGEKAGGYDATQGGEKIINSEVRKKDKAGNPIIVRDVTLRAPDDAIQIKTITQIDKYGRPSTKPLPQLVADNVKAAMKKAYNQPVTRARARTPLPGTNIYERTNVEAPKKITIIVQVPGEVTKEMIIAGANVAATDTMAAELPPIEVIVQTAQ